MERQQIQDLWRGRLQESQLRLDLATRNVKEVQRDLGASPDGHYERAIRAQNVALTEYTRILRTFSHLVIDGKIPA